MADVTLSTSHAVTAEQFNDQTFQEYLKKQVLAKYMGTSSESMVHVNEDLGKSPGDAITFNLVSQVDGAGISGDSTLEGNEEAFSVYGQRVTVNQYRNAIRLAGKLTEQRSPFSLREQQRPQLVNWMAQKGENDVFSALHTLNGTAYASAAEVAVKDAWLAANSDRVLFGAATSNNASNDHSAALLEIDGTNDILDTDQISLARRLAQLANPKIRPIRLEGGEEIYVMFAHPYCVRDLKASTAWQQAQREAKMRGDMNPIFTGAAGMYDGVVVVETDRISLLSGVGASSIDVAANFLCGAQAVLWAQAGVDGQKMVMKEDQFDYENQVGVAIASMYGVAKAVFNGKDHGVVTTYSAAVAD